MAGHQEVDSKVFLSGIDLPSDLGRETERCQQESLEYIQDCWEVRIFPTCELCIWAYWNMPLLFRAGT